jgi:hypothetical protein
MNTEIEIKKQYLEALNAIIAGLRAKENDLPFEKWLTLRGAEIEREITLRYLSGKI